MLFSPVIIVLILACSSSDYIYFLRRNVSSRKNAASISPESTGTFRMLADLSRKGEPVWTSLTSQKRSASLLL